MPRTRAEVSTEYGSAYMKRLCRHFSHKLDVEVGETSATIHFPFGDCRIDVTDSVMTLDIDVPDSDELDRAERVAGDHLVRMANRDEPVVHWVRE